MKTAAIIGATGAVGEQLLDILLQENDYDQVLLFTRRSCGIEHEKLTEKIIELNELDTITEGTPNIDAAFCCLGTTRKKAGSFARFQEIDRDYVLNFARFTKSYGAKSFSVVSAMGASKHSLSGYMRTKGEMEHLLKQAGFEQLNIIQPAGLYGERSEHRPMEATGIKAMEYCAPLMIGPLQKMRPVRFRQVANTVYQSSLKSGTGINTLDNAVILDH